LSDDVGWVDFQRELSGHSVSSYGQVTQDGLLQFGHSKDHRPDLPQIKIMLATLDPN
jgi:transposase